MSRHGDSPRLKQGEHDGDQGRANGPLATMI
jgi:hypothetical protein